MKYAIIVNPKAGSKTIEEKEKILQPAMRILNVRELYGLETKSVEEFCECARDLAKNGNIDCLVFAGGDGTCSDIANVVNNIPLGFIPLGRGEAMRYSLGIPKSAADAAYKISKGKEHRHDLVLANGSLAMFSSLGIDSQVSHESDQLMKKGWGGFSSYALATCNSYFRSYKNINAKVNIDGNEFDIENALTLVAATFPYYGYGLKIMPQAKMSGGEMHFLSVSNVNLAKLVYGLATGFTIGNRVGEHQVGKNVKITTFDDVFLQRDGTSMASDKGRDFEFEVKPEALKMIY